MIETTWPARPKIFPIWPFTEKDHCLFFSIHSSKFIHMATGGLTRFQTHSHGPHAKVTNCSVYKTSSEAGKFQENFEFPVGHPGKTWQLAFPN